MSENQENALMNEWQQALSAALTHVKDNVPALPAAIPSLLANRQTPVVGGFVCVREWMIECVCVCVGIGLVSLMGSWSAWDLYSSCCAPSAAAGASFADVGSLHVLFMNAKAFGWAGSWTWILACTTPDMITNVQHVPPDH